MSFTRNHNVPLRLRKKLGKITPIAEQDFSLSFFGQVFTGNTGIHMDHKIYLYGCHEAATVELLRHLLKHSSNKIFVDIGMNSAMHILATAQVFDKAYGFEPNPHVFNKAKDNIQSNNLQDHVHLFKFGLSDQDASLPFAYPANNNLGIGQFVEEETGDTLEVKQGDTLFAQENIVPDVIKIDVEGHEKKVLDGLKETIRAKQPYIIFEYADDARVDMGPKENRQQLFGDQYKYFGILRSRQKPKLEPFKPERKYENTLAIPDKDIPKIQKFL